jgi:hypothetical protein|eukprot:gnl/Ergobibamus_cyprinoides/5828.p1 GENE.gnl/Ergobibamus_cyprinoides/5828~~gnl/Ergobibamus_cyprinoides/5828.p1  ORF type:complete len:135 (+),score=6.84 gnl/Ergobibamus_cyprinoides/5828:348-752(+)
MTGPAILSVWGNAPALLRLLRLFQLLLELGPDGAGAELQIAALPAVLSKRALKVHHGLHRPGGDQLHVVLQFHDLPGIAVGGLHTVNLREVRLLVELDLSRLTISDVSWLKAAVMSSARRLVSSFICSVKPGTR